MKLDERIKELQGEHAKGVALINQLRAQLEDTQATVLRVEGAIQVCREIQKQEDVVTMEPK